MSFRTPQAWFAIVAVATLLCIFGCDKPKGTSATGSTSSTGTTIAASRPAGPVGTIKGIALFTGTSPQAILIAGRTCHAKGRDTMVNPVVVGKNHELMETVVFLKGAGGDPPSNAGPMVVLDQVDCQYTPGAVALHTGQMLRVTSQDPTLHNVHFLAIDNPAMNVGMNGAGQKVDAVLNVPESFQVKCDVHPWMSAAVNVFDHPYFAVTDKDGKFVIKNVPVGKQNLIFRHAFLGDIELDVTVEEGKTADVTGTFDKAEK